jgi:hypothetical protein
MITSKPANETFTPDSGFVVPCHTSSGNHERMTAE